MTGTRASGQRAADTAPAPMYGRRRMKSMTHDYLHSATLHISTHTV